MSAIFAATASGVAAAAREAAERGSVFVFTSGPAGSPFSGYGNGSDADVIQVLVDFGLAVATVGGDGPGRFAGALLYPLDGMPNPYTTTGPSIIRERRLPPGTDTPTIIDLLFRGK